MQLYPQLLEISSATHIAVSAQRVSPEWAWIQLGHIMPFGVTANVARQPLCYWRGGQMSRALTSGAGGHGLKPHLSQSKDLQSWYSTCCLVLGFTRIGQGLVSSVSE